MSNPGSRTEVHREVVGPFQENTFFLKGVDDSRIVVIDPGDEFERLMQRVTEQNWEPVAVVNTHAHLDHIGAVASFQRQYGIPFYLHREEQVVLDQAPGAARMFGVPEPDAPVVDHYLEPDRPLHLAGLAIEVRSTPGHSPGGVSLVVDGRAIAGDALFYGSIGRTDLPGGNLDLLLTSIRSALLSLPDETIVHCGHGPDTTIGRERRLNPFLTGTL